MSSWSRRRWPLLAILLGATALGGTSCKKRKDLRGDEALKVVVAQDRKLAKQEQDLLSKRGALRRERVRLRDKRRSLITQKMALTDVEPGKRQKIEAEESQLSKLESKLIKQELQLNNRLTKLLAAKTGLVDKAEKSAGVKTLLLARREGSLAAREKGLARRESELARREKAMAAREQALALRQAKLCPGRVTTVVQTIPAAAPRRRGGSERQYKRKDVEPVYRSALSAMRKKGILVADLPPGIDRLVTSVRHAVSKGKYTKAKYAADQLLSAVRRMRIDRSFIGAKIGRLGRSIKRRPPRASRKATVQRLFQKATGDYGDGRFRAANKKLNRIYALL
jgi:hypothetical protein